MNAGQTCVSPDYIFCPERRINELVGAIRLRNEAMYPASQGYMQRTRVINSKQYQRLMGYLEDAKSKGAEVIPLGEMLDNA